MSDNELDDAKADDAKADDAKADDAKADDAKADDGKPDPEEAKRQFARRADRRRIRELEADIERLKTADSKGAEDDKLPEKPTRPKSKDFELGRFDPKFDDAVDEYEEKLEAYNDAKAAHTAKQAKREAVAERQAAAAQSAYEKSLEKFEKKALDKYDDFEDVVVDALEAMPVDRAALLSAIDLENGHEVLYHLAQNQDELERITALSPMAQALEFGKLSEKLGGKAKETKPANPSKSETTPKTPRGKDGKYTTDEDARYERMLKARQAG